MYMKMKQLSAHSIDALRVSVEKMHASNKVTPEALTALSVEYGVSPLALIPAAMAWIAPPKKESWKIPAQTIVPVSGIFHASYDGKEIIVIRQGNRFVTLSSVLKPIPNSRMDWDSVQNVSRLATVVRNKEEIMTVEERRKNLEDMVKSIQAQLASLPSPTTPKKK